MGRQWKGKGSQVTNQDTVYSTTHTGPTIKKRPITRTARWYPPVTQTKTENPSKSESCDNDFDRFVKAGRIITGKDEAAIRMLLQYFKDGLDWAVRIMSQLEACGVIRKTADSSRIQVLMTAGQFEQLVTTYNGRLPSFSSTKQDTPVATMGAQRVPVPPGKKKAVSEPVKKSIPTSAKEVRKKDPVVTPVETHSAPIGREFITNDYRVHSDIKPLPDMPSMSKSVLKEIYPYDGMLLKSLANIVVPSVTDGCDTQDLFIETLLKFNSPYMLRLVLLDPAKVMYLPYKGRPHLLFPVATEAAGMRAILDWLNQEVESRIQHFTANGVRNIDAYNTKAKVMGTETLPRIVCSVSEASILLGDVPFVDAMEYMVFRSSRVGVYFVLFSQIPVKHFLPKHKKDMFQELTPEELIARVSPANRGKA